MLLEKSLDQYVYLIPQHDGVEEESKTLKNQSLDSNKCIKEEGVSYKKFFIKRLSCDDNPCLMEDFDEENNFINECGPFSD